jgi:CHASE2 domain-containing sensor protein
MWVLRRPSVRIVTVLIVIVVAAAVGLGLMASGVLGSLEKHSVDLRFGIRSTAPASDVVVVGIDDQTFDHLKLHWPFPRMLAARAIDRLADDGARTIVYDVQFTEPTDPRDDNALYAAIARAGNVVLATSETDASGHTNVLGGDANLARAHSRAAAANLPADDGGVIRRYPYQVNGLDSLAVAAAQRYAGSTLSPALFPSGTAWIDFRGPPGAIPTVSFWSLLAGRVPPSTFAGKVVVVGATSPTLGDVHPAAVGGAQLMSGPEIQANAIWTALHGNPLRAAPGWVGILAVLLAALLVPLASLRARVVVWAPAVVGLAGGYALLAQLSFDHGLIIPVTYPLAAWATAAIGSLLAGYLAASLYGTVLQREVHRRTEELRESQLEVIIRLAHAAESRDPETGRHIQRIGALCARLGLACGMDPTEAEMLRYASAMHDVGKIGTSDAILLKPGPLTEAEWAAMREHTTIGASILAGSPSALIQMAETIALTHHERWDGSGYPRGLKGEDIPLVGRICAICDVFDALTSNRPYKGPWSVTQALAECRQGRGTLFDPKLLDAFVTLVSAEGFRAEEPSATDGADLASVGSTLGQTRARTRDAPSLALPAPLQDPRT